ncbi:MAG TPA: hypothetical protein VLZ77_02120 [Acidimicrobiales bacterium]|nr:hypothetical protein [Acidimicrobiales bacterium]
MSRRTNRLLRDVEALVEATENLRNVMRGFARVNATMARRVGQGDDLVATLESLEGPLRRREVTEALDEFETARHRVRLSMFGVAEEQDASISEVARALGISRQLASRLAAEADGAQGRRAAR